MIWMEAALVAVLFVNAWFTWRLIRSAPSNVLLRNLKDGMDKSESLDQLKARMENLAQKR